MIDVNKITSTLAKLPDAQLQQYAQMHKADPYIMALAMSESNRRKELRAAGQGAQGMQEQPKVVDQMVAEMAPQQLPEDQGIGQLNAGDMNFAGGGIVAFADGGDVEHYYGGGSTAIYDPVTGVPISAENTSGNDLTFLESIGVFNPENRRALEKADRAAAQKQTAPPYNKATMPVPGYTRTDPRAAGADTFADSVKAVSAAPKTDTGKRGTGAATTASATLPSLTDLTDLRQRISDKQDFKDPAAAGLLELEARERAAAAADKQAIERDAERFKDAYKGREARLAEREADIGKQKDSNMGLALLNAGLAIMSTPGGLATAIGKGAQVGTAQFAAGLDKIRSAQERLGEARDRLDDLKLNREESTAKEIRAAENNYRRVSIDAQKRTIDGIRMAADVNEKRATDIYGKTVDMTKTMYEQQQANARNAATVAATNRTPAEIQMVERVMKEKNIPFTEALALLSSSKREGVSEEKLRGEWLDTAKRQQIAMDYPNVKTFEDYKTVMGMGGGAGGFKVVGTRPGP